MNPYALPSFISVLPFLFLGVTVLLQNPRSLANRLLCALSLSAALVAFTAGMLHLATTQAQATFWNRWPYVFAYLTFWLMLEYTINISGGYRMLRDKLWGLPLKWHYVLILIVISLSIPQVLFTDTLIAQPAFHTSTGWEHGHGPYISFSAIGGLYLVYVSFTLLRNGIKKAHGPIQRRGLQVSMAALVIAPLVTLVVGMICPVYLGIQTHAFTAFAWLILCFVLSYELMRQQRETIQDFRYSLEKKVARRTQELARRTEDLARAKRDLEEAQVHISKYLDPNVVEKIFAGKFSAELTSRRAKLTMFFSDIKDFTKFTDGSDPEEVARLLNEYLGEMGQIVRHWGGTIPQFTGDAIYAIFGAPDTKGERGDALAAVRMALAMQERMEFLGEKWWNQGTQFPFKIRCGIHTGMANVGNYGSEGFMEFSAIGLNVNLASRLEHICEPGKIYISHATWAQVKDEIACQEVGTIEVKGFHHPIQTYKVLGEKPGRDGNSCS